ncbi:MAG: DUF3015 family protein [Oligoflexia bacterium]|nr:DUF3015 family protein [Oligoflexia bacterium]MBF0366911.1 DUF3015 family protein [Oligoflexia bacterium]
MKIIKSTALLILSMTILSPLAALADSSVGCGLGWQVTKAMTTTAATTRVSTNFTFSNTFAMTSGTSGCAQHSLVMKQKLDLHFVEANYQNIQIDMANGSGEYLFALARTMGCPEEVTAIFGNESRKHFNEIFSTSAEKENPQGALQSLKRVIKNHHLLVNKCNPVG